MRLIPRHLGDRPDARGGSRWVIPDKASSADCTTAEQRGRDPGFRE